MKLQSALIMAIIVGSLIPVYLLYIYLQRKVRPRDSGKRLVIWFLLSFALIFGYSFLLVFIIKMLFPGA